MPQEFKFEIESEYNKTRVDKIITLFVDELSRSHAQLLIDENNVLVNGQPTKANYKLKTGDCLEVIIPDPIPLDVIPEAMDLDIYYEDEDVIVVNKPSGMVVHPGAGNGHGTLVNGLMAHCTDLSGINGILRPGIVHRIDKDTSGLLMVAKNDFAHESLVNQLREKTVTRKYIAIVIGVIEHDYGTIDAPIARDKVDRQKMAVSQENSKHAVTHFKVIKRMAHHTLVECVLETGRTHQIRVHMKYINYPLLGDPKYGPKKVEGETGQFLHAATLGFNHPVTGEYLEFSAPLPDYFQAKIEELEKL